MQEARVQENLILAKNVGYMDIMMISFSFPFFFLGGGGSKFLQTYIYTFCCSFTINIHSFTSTVETIRQIYVH